MSTENRHRIEPWRVAAMLLVTVIAAVAVYYLLTDTTRIVAAILNLVAAMGCMAYLVRGTGP